MSGRRDESLLLDDVVGAGERLVELGDRSLPGPMGESRDANEQVLWNLVVLGEAVKRMQRDTRARFPDVPWSAIAMTRDRVAHHYEGIDWEVVGNIVRIELPALVPRLREIRDALRTEFDAGGGGDAETRPGPG